MKRLVGTAILFVLLVLTIVALTQINHDKTSAGNATQSVSHAVN